MSLLFFIINSSVKANKHIFATQAVIYIYIHFCVPLKITQNDLAKKSILNNPTLQGATALTRT